MTQEQDPQAGADGPRARAVRALLAEVAAPRERVIDDHMFTVGRNHQPAAAFRLQLFTAPGTRPVAVVIQRHGEGASMFNAAERYAEAVCRGTARARRPRRSGSSGSSSPGATMTPSGS